MRYTWGYIVKASLAKLNLTQAEAVDQGFITRFPLYANEAMAQICSAVKPKEVYFDVLSMKNKHKGTMPDDFVSFDDDLAFYKPEDVYGHITLYYDNSVEEVRIDAFGSKLSSLVTVGEENGEEVMYYNGSKVKRVDLSEPVGTNDYQECFDEDLTYVGYNEFVCERVGTYKIPYKATWFFFDPSKLTGEDDPTIVDAPADIILALPSYIASQCLKIDDELKANIYRNEFEMALARLDDTSFSRQRSFRVGGGW